MKTLTTLSLFAILALSSVGCMTIPTHISGDSADVSSSDASSSRADTSADSATPRNTCESRCGESYLSTDACHCDSECVANGDCCNDYPKFCAANPGCVDADGDGWCTTAPKKGDCNDNNKNVNPDEAESCGPSGTGNGIDDNCNGVTDEGCPTTSLCNANTASLGKVCYGKNGVCASAPGYTECNGGSIVCSTDVGGSQSKVTAESCDGLDNNCNGSTDEGCSTTTNPTPGNAVLTVKYPDSASRRLSFGVTTDVASIPYVWTALTWQTSDTFVANLGFIQAPTSNCLYVRFNVDEPNGQWLAEGSGSSAHLNAAAYSTLNLSGILYTSPKVISIGSGSSAIFAISYNNAVCSF